MDIYLIRHTTPDIDQGICYGQSDLELASNFGKEAKAVHFHLEKSIDYIFSSPLDRCMQLANTFDATVQSDPRLMEISFGQWEMKAWKDLPQSTVDQWKENQITQGPPNGESYQQLKNRVVEIFQGIISQNRKSTGIITHAGPIRAILSHVLHMPLKDTFTLRIDYGSVTKVSLDQSKFSVDYINKR